MQKIAAASTRVGVHSSHSLNASAGGSGRIMFLQYLIMACLPATVVAVVGGGGGQIMEIFVLAAKLVAGWAELQQQEPESIAPAK